MASTSGASAEPQAAVATKQPESCVNFMEGVVNVTEAIGEAGVQGSRTRTAAEYWVAGFSFGMVTEASVPGPPGCTCGALAAEPNCCSVIVDPVR